MGVSTRQLERVLFARQSGVGLEIPGDWRADASGRSESLVSGWKGVFGAIRRLRMMAAAASVGSLRGTVPESVNKLRTYRRLKEVRESLKQGAPKRTRQLLTELTDSWQRVTDPEMLHYWARVFVLEENRSAAIGCWTRALAADSEFLPAWEGLAQQLRYDGSRWRFFYLGLLRDRWENDKLLLEAARNFRRHGEPRLALDAWQELWRRDPGPEIVNGLMEALLKLQDYAGLEAFCSGHPEAWADAQSDDMQRRALESGLVNGLLDNLLAEDPGQVALILKLMDEPGSTGLSESGEVLAVGQLSDFLQRNLVLVKRADRVVDLLERCDGPATALGFLEYLLRDRPHDLGRLHRRGRLLLKLERYGEMQELYESLEHARNARLIAPKTDFHDVFASLAHLHFLKRDETRALDYVYRAAAESRRGFGKALYILFHLERYGELARCALWMRSRIAWFPLGELVQLNAATQVGQMSDSQKTRLRLALGARLRDLRPHRPEDARVMMKNRAIALRSFRFGASAGLPAIFRCIEDAPNFAEEYAEGLSGVADFAHLATWNHYTGDSLGLDFATPDGPALRPVDEAGKRAVEVFIPDACFVEQSRQTAAHAQIRLIFNGLLEQLRARGYCICPRHQMANGIADPAPDGRLVFSYHTRNGGPAHWHFKESHLPGFFHFDAYGYSGWSELARLSRAEIESLKMRLAAYPQEAVDRCFDSLLERFVRKRVSKYEQPEVGLEVLGDRPYVLVILQKIDDTVARFTSLSPFDFVPEICGYFAAGETQVVLKRHPFCQSPEIHSMLGRLRREEHVHVLDASIHDLLADAECVFTVNSGVGFEALLHDKPVVTFGATDYNLATTFIRSSAHLKRFLETGDFRPEPLQRAFVYHYLKHVVVDVEDSQSLRTRIAEALSRPVPEDPADPAPTDLPPGEWIELSRNLAGSGFVEAALRIYHARTETGSLSGAGLDRYLACLRRGGLFEQASDLVSAALADGRLSEAETLYQRGKIAGDAGLPRRALGYYEQARVADPVTFNPRYHGARVALAQGRIGEWIADLRKLAHEHLSNYDVQALLGWSEIAVGEVDNALKLWNRLAKTARGRKDRNNVQAAIACATTARDGPMAAWAYLLARDWRREDAHGATLSPLDASSRQVVRMRELVRNGAEVAIVLTDANFWRGEGGSHARIREVVRETAREAGCPVWVLFTGRLSPADLAGMEAFTEAEVFPLMLVPSLFAADGRVTRPGRQLKRARFSKGFLPAGEFLRFAMAQLLGRVRPRCVVFEYLWMDYLLPAVPAGVPTIIDTHDVHFQRAASLVERGMEPHIGISASEEREILHDYDRILAISERDHQTLRSLSNELPVICFPHVPAIRSLTAPDQIRRIGFVGGAHAPNVDALKWLLEEIWPAMDALPIGLHLYGHATRSVRGFPPRRGVRVHGFVPDLEAIYAHCDLMIAPLRFGSGLKIKVVEALAHGRPVIGTGVAFQGIAVDGVATHPAESPAAFRAVIEQLRIDPGRLGEASRQAPEVVRKLGRDRQALLPATARSPKASGAAGAPQDARQANLYEHV